MDTCNHCKVDYVTAAANRNHCYQGYCSRYCFEASQNKVKPILDLDAPADYGLDDRYMAFLKFFDGL